MTRAAPRLNLGVWFPWWFIVLMFPVMVVWWLVLGIFWAVVLFVRLVAWVVRGVVSSSGDSRRPSRR